MVCLLNINLLFFFFFLPLLKPVKFEQNDFLYKCDDMIDEIYFITKGTISFSLDKKYWEREIKEIKKIIILKKLKCV